MDGKTRLQQNQHHHDAVKRGEHAAFVGIDEHATDHEWQHPPHHLPTAVSKRPHQPHAYQRGTSAHDLAQRHIAHEPCRVFKRGKNRQHHRQAQHHERQKRPFCVQPQQAHRTQYAERAHKRVRCTEPIAVQAQVSVGRCACDV